MGEQFAIQIPYNVIVNPNNYLEQVNKLLAGFCKRQFVKEWAFEVLYSLSVNSETGATRVEGKVKTEDGRLEINDFEMPWVLSGVEFKGTTTHPRYIRLYRIGQCIENVLGWSKARGILDNGKWTTQVTKFYEEDGEAATGISKTRKRLIMDGLGDALVVLVNILALTKFGAEHIEEALASARDRLNSVAPFGDAHRLFHKMRLDFTQMNDAFYQIEDWHTANGDGEKIKEGTPTVFLMGVDAHLVNALWHMEALARAYDVTLEQCFSLAWDEIKDRKGFLNADGIFVKEADMTEEQKAAQATA